MSLIITGNFSYSELCLSYLYVASPVTDLVTEEGEGRKKDTWDHKTPFPSSSSHREIYPFQLSKSLHRSILSWLSLAWDQHRRVKNIKLNQSSPHVSIPHGGVFLVFWPWREKKQISLGVCPDCICCMVLGFRTLWSSSSEVWEGKTQECLYHVGHASSSIIYFYCYQIGALCMLSRNFNCN